MDNDQARFILNSFRPDGADAADPSFAEALKLAVENRELGEWLAEQRAFDAAFANALGSVELPEHFREDLIAGLAMEHRDFPQAEDANDALMIHALSSLQPPPQLRSQLIAALETSSPVAVPKVSNSRKWVAPLTLAAGVALGFFVTRRVDPPLSASAPPLKGETVLAGFSKIYGSPLFRLQEKSQSLQELTAHLAAENLPAPCSLPPGLQQLKGIGCRDIIMGGKRGSLVCFHIGEKGVLHLLVFRCCDVVDEPKSPTAGPAFSEGGGWASARWMHGENVYFAMSQAPLATVTALF